jgi:3-methylcrotonyl-CoA carboxylase alpha subunit
VRLAWGDERHDVAVHQGPEGTVVVIDGRRMTLRLEGRAPGPFHLRCFGRLASFHCVRDGDEVHLFWEGVAYRLRLERDGPRPAPRGSSGGLEAPMPGKVIAIRVKAGQAVRKGEELLVVEAMKMENALRAPRDGVVKGVRAGLGDMVNPGAVLVELE